MASDCRAAAQALLAQPEPALKAVAVRVADGLSGAAGAAEVAAWLVDPDRPEPASSPACAAPMDPLPALLNAARAYLVVVAAAVWMAMRWPNGPAAITWAALPILLMSPRQETAFQAALLFSVGTVLAAGLAAVVKFAVLPQVETFWALSAALAAVLAPLNGLVAHPRRRPHARPPHGLPAGAPGHVDSVARGIQVANAQPDAAGLARSAGRLRPAPLRRVAGMRHAFPALVVPSVLWAVFRFGIRDGRAPPVLPSRTSRCPLPLAYAQRQAGKREA